MAMGPPVPPPTPGGGPPPRTCLPVSRYSGIRGAWLPSLVYRIMLIMGRNGAIPNDINRLCPLAPYLGNLATMGRRPKYMLGPSGGQGP